MLKKDLILRSPVEKTIGTQNVTDGKFGAVISRAGVGKTSFLVQIALTQLLKKRKIVHISLDDTIEKINLRYHDGYTNLVDSIGYVDPLKAARVWDDIHTDKVGISYTEATFNTDKIRDYLKSFKKADLELPAMIILDGIDFDQDTTTLLDSLETLYNEFPVFTWFSMKCHREEQLCPDGLPIQLENYKDRFDKAILLKPVEDKIETVILKDGDRTQSRSHIDPATMMVIAPE